MPVILRYVKISRLHVLNQGESYLSILKLLRAEALGIDLSLVNGIFLFPISSDRPDLICMHTVLLNTFF
jgi:hypothetical protein